MGTFTNRRGLVIPAIPGPNDRQRAADHIHPGRGGLHSKSCLLHRNVLLMNQNYGSTLIEFKYHKFFPYLQKLKSYSFVTFSDLTRNFFMSLLLVKSSYSFGMNRYLSKINLGKTSEILRMCICDTRLWNMGEGRQVQSEHPGAQFKQYWHG